MAERKGKNYYLEVPLMSSKIFSQQIRNRKTEAQNAPMKLIILELCAAISSQPSRSLLTTSESGAAASAGRMGCPLGPNPRI